jgi:hypothetical protein
MPLKAQFTLLEKWKGSGARLDAREHVEGVDGFHTIVAWQLKPTSLVLSACTSSGNSSRYDPQAKPLGIADFYLPGADRRKSSRSAFAPGLPASGRRTPTEWVEARKQKTLFSDLPFSRFPRPCATNFVFCCTSFLQMIPAAVHALTCCCMRREEKLDETLIARLLMDYFLPEWI